MRRRPHVELLDDRCLLSTGGAIKLFEHGAFAAFDRRHALVRHPHAAAIKLETLAKTAGHNAAAHNAGTPPATPSAVVERPAGSIEVGATTAYDPITGAAAARSTFHVDGTGMTVAVIDTGVDYNNSALGGSFGPNAKIIAGYDFGDGNSDPMATTSQHGTAIAGLIGSSDPTDLGVAPGVKIVALKVTNSANVASLDNVANALQWVIANHSAYNITAVNMSLSDGGNYAQNWFASDGGAGQEVTQLIGQLTALNIPVIAATGNSFAGVQGEGFSAIVAGTISVTATDLSGNLLGNAQRLGTAIGGTSATTIAAPGEGLTAPSGDSGTATVEGTSFATALVTGGVTLLQDVYQSRFGSLPTVDQIKSWLQGGATLVTDPVTGITLGELNIQQAAALIPFPAPAPVAPPVVSPPVVVTIPTPAPPTSIPAPVSSTPAPVSVPVYLDGQQLNSTLSNSAGALNQSAFAQLLKAMSAWLASPFTGTQVQIWKA
jgi:type VI secretion system secreted protein VgrG